MTPAERIYLLTQRGLYDALLAICESRMVTTREVLGQSRYRHVVDARRAFVAYLRFDRELSYPAIGELIGRDHTSVMSLLRPVVGLLPKYPGKRWARASGETGSY